MQVLIICAGGCGASVVADVKNLTKHDYYVCDSNKECLHNLKKRLFPDNEYIIPSITINAVDGFYGLDFDTTVDNRIRFSLKKEQLLFTPDNRLLFIPKKKMLPLSLRTDEEIFEYFESTLFLSKFEEISAYYPSDIAFEIIDNEFGTSKESIVKTIRSGNYDHLLPYHVCESKRIG